MQQGSISLQAMSIDCLNTIKHFALIDTINVLESANSQVRQTLMRTTQEHMSMAEDWFQLMNRRGWYQVPEARPEVRNQLNNFVSSVQSNIGQRITTGGQAGYQTPYGQQPYTSPYAQQSVAKQGNEYGTGGSGSKYLS
ncbi:MAG: spore coat protein [Clostridia bacterium]|nr:spore coat protein [Clostridia bacterium]